MLNDQFKNYRSNISIKSFENKLYIDPQYGAEESRSTINYAIFSSKWDIEEIGEDNQIKIIHRESGDSITLAFNSRYDKIQFVKNIYASRPIKQIGRGMNLEQYANLHLKPKLESFVDKVLKN